MLLYPDDFACKNPPYEYEYELLPLDCILGDISVRKNLADGVSVLELEDQWRKELTMFDKLRQDYFLYR